MQVQNFSSQSMYDIMFVYKLMQILDIWKHMTQINY